MKARPPQTCDGSPKESGLKGFDLIISDARVGPDAAEDAAATRDKARQVVSKLRAQRPTKAAEFVETLIEETPAYCCFPDERRQCIRTNNPLERILREIRRRTRVVDAFPVGQSALYLAASRFRHVAGTEWSTKR